MANRIVADKAKKSCAPKPAKPPKGMTGVTSEQWGYRAFENPRVILVQSDVAGHRPGYWDEEGIGLFQAEAGPTHLVIGRQAGEDQLQRAAARFRLDVNEIRSFRDGGPQRREIARLDRRETSHG